MKVLLCIAAVSVVFLAVVCVGLFMPIGSQNYKLANKEFQLVQNPLRKIVYAAEFPSPYPKKDGVSESAIQVMPDLNPEDAIFETKLNKNQTTANVTIEGIEKADGVALAVWSEDKGQDDLVWYEMDKDSKGVFNVEIPVKNHRTEGTYKADAYVIRQDDTKYSIGTTGFSISGPTLERATVTKVNSKAGTFQIAISKAVSVSTAKKAKVKVYPTESSKKIHEYEVELSSDGNGVVDCNVSNHGYVSGEYKAEVTIVDGNEIEKMLSSITTQIDLPQMSISQNMKDGNTIVNLNIDNLIENSVSRIDFQVYSKNGGKDDLVSYPGSAISASSYEANVVLSNHHTAGDYQVDVYAVRGNGKKELIGSTTFNVAAPVAGAISILQKKEDDEYFKTALKGAFSDSGITQIKFQIIRASDGKESWYEAINPSTGQAEITVDIKEQTESVDTYTITGYVKDANGIEVKTSSTEVSMTLLNNGKYKIMGQTRTNVSQMVKYFKSHGTYPAAYANTDAPTIEAFCQIFYDEAVAEGVRAEVAFCQAMKETGYLKFGGDVSEAQYNFAGIGATGNGACGNSFGSITEGIRAQIQHLKAYASTDSLNKACVDPRFSYVKRGSAVYVEWLGIRENPNGGGWAASEGYGSSIVNSYIKKLFSY